MLEEGRPAGGSLKKSSSTKEELLAAYRTMLLTRVLDQKALSLHNQGKIGSYTSSAGHEATQVGSVYGLKPNDYIFPYYRDQGVLLARGVPPEKVMNRYFGNASDEMKGRDLPNLYSFREYRIFSNAAPIASNLQISVGYAMAAKMKKEDDLVAVSYLGDGATSSGEFHVALNFAGVYKVPCIFICENNQYAISVPVTRQTASKNISMKARAYGIVGETVDGNDFFAVQAAVSAARERAIGGVATLIECVTYRYSPHSSADDWKRYRTNAEVEKWKKKDPVTVMRDKLLGMSVMTKELEKKLAEQVQEQVNAAVKSTEAIPDPPKDSLITDVYAKVPDSLRDQSSEEI